MRSWVHRRPQAAYWPRLRIARSWSEVAALESREGVVCLAAWLVAHRLVSAEAMVELEVLVQLSRLRVELRGSCLELMRVE